MTLTSRELLSRAIAAAEHTPDQWAPHVWSQLAAAAVAVERGERENELHGPVLEWQRKLTAPPADGWAGPPPAATWAVGPDVELDGPVTVCPVIGCSHSAAIHYGEGADVELNDPTRVGCAVHGCRCKLSAERVLERIAAFSAGSAPTDVDDYEPTRRTVDELLQVEQNAPRWLSALFRAWLDGRTLDFGGATPPAWVQEWLVAKFGPESTVNGDDSCPACGHRRHRGDECGVPDPEPGEPVCRCTGPAGDAA